MRITEAFQTLPNFRAAAGAGRGVRLDHHHGHGRDRHRLLAGLGAA
jgi:hypothetical protein